MTRSEKNGDVVLAAMLGGYLHTSTEYYKCSTLYTITNTKGRLDLM